LERAESLFKMVLSRTTEACRMTFITPQSSTDVRLTPREREVLHWHGKAKTSWEIGCILGCAEATVNFHFANIRGKFGVGSRLAAWHMAHAQGLLPVD
jgi:DNA-binding CsgD family transcriptional regulator